MFLFESECAIYQVLIFSCNIGVAATKDHDIGTTNLHIEVSDVVNILVYVGIAKGNGVLSKSGKGNLIVSGAEEPNHLLLLKLTLKWVKDIHEYLLKPGRFFASRICTYVNSAQNTEQLMNYEMVHQSLFTFFCRYR